jgi:hypothetical protein
MFKFIVTAEKEADIIALMTNTRGVDLPSVKWDVTRIYHSEEDVVGINRWELDDAVLSKEWDRVDDAIMSGDVPTGGMVVVADEGISPMWGYVCGNGQEWFKVNLPVEIRDAIFKMVHPHARYFVVNGPIVETFKTKTDLGEWMEGLDADHYESLLAQLQEGKTILDHNA